MIAVLLLSLLACTCGLVGQYFWVHRKFYRLYNKLPLAVPHLPIIGVGHKFIMADSKKLYKLTTHMTDHHGPSPRRIYAGPMSFVVVDEPEQFKAIFTSRNCTDKIFLYKKFLLRSG
jgi:hypothetical protein